VRILRRGGFLLVAVACCAAAAHLTLGRGVGGRELAIDAVRRAFAGLDYHPVGAPEASFVGNQELAWAIEWVHRDGGPAATSGGALLWRVQFPGGGEGAATPDGVVWAARRPIPADPGANHFPATVQRPLRENLARVFPDVEQWRWTAGQSWREGNVTWHRVTFTIPAGGLPEGWESSIEVEMAGSTVISFQRHTEPLASDVGVVMGRIAELELLRSVGLLGLVLVLIGVIVAGAEQVAFRRQGPLFAGLVVGAVTWVAGTAAGLPPWECALGAVVSGGVIGLLPRPADQFPSRLLLAAPAGIAVALALLALPRLVAALGGWLPVRSAFPPQYGVSVLAGKMWFPALTEEPLLRGALPFLAAPIAGWWGGALVGALVGCLLHPVPAVPLAASLAAELGLHLGMAAVARWGGLASAILARGVCEGLIRRASFPAGGAADALILGSVVVALLAALQHSKRRRA
jgi:hypothetical protein